MLYLYYSYLCTLFGCVSGALPSKSKNTMTKLVILRKRKRSNGIESLYLAIADGHGKRHYEHLNLYLHPGEDRATKAANRKTLEVAERITAKRLAELECAAYGLPVSVSLYEYVASFLKRKSSLAYATRLQYRAAFTYYLQGYQRNDIRLSECSTAWLAGFRDWLLQSDIGTNSASVYLVMVKSLLHQAYKDGAITKDIAATVEGIPAKGAERQYLTTSELRALYSTPCEKNDVKRAFLFSCLTGLRISDIITLEWSNIINENGAVFVAFRQQKTKELQRVFLNTDALAIVGERGEGRVFTLPHRSDINEVVARWVADAGITKHITFHCARHTFATSLLSAGVDIYTTSKLLGHTSVKTTQIYAKVVDEKKKQAVDLLPKLG